MLNTFTPPHEGQQDLFDRITDPANLLAGWKRVRRNRGSHGGDGVTWQRFESRLEFNLNKLHQDLSNGHYRPGRLRSVHIKKPGGGQRRLAIPPIRDRVAQTAAALALTPMLDKLMSHASFAYRPGRSVEMALHEVRDAIAHGRVWVVDLDIAKFFERIPHQRLMMELAIWAGDERFLALCGRWLRSFSFWRSVFHKGRGLAQGAPISPLLANLYLHPVDRLLAAANIQAIRFADDIVILCKTQQAAEQAKSFMESMIIGRGLSINAAKSSILHASQGFVYLGAELGGPNFAEKPVLDVTNMLEQKTHADTIHPQAAKGSEEGKTAGAGLALEDRRRAAAAAL